MYNKFLITTLTIETFEHQNTLITLDICIKMCMCYLYKNVYVLLFISFIQFNKSPTQVTEETYDWKLYFVK